MDCDDQTYHMAQPHTASYRKKPTSLWPLAQLRVAGHKFANAFMDACKGKPFVKQQQAGHVKTDQALPLPNQLTVTSYTEYLPSGYNTPGISWHCSPKPVPISRIPLDTPTAPSQPNICRIADCTRMVALCNNAHSATAWTTPTLPRPKS